MHETPHPLSGQTVILQGASDPDRGVVIARMPFTVEDWWDRVSGETWYTSTKKGNPAALMYTRRLAAVLADGGTLPSDNEVVYGKIDGLWHLVHVSEIEG